MAWIQIDQALPTHRKTLKLADTLDITPTHAVGLMVTLWLWSLDNAPSGDLGDISSRTLARILQWDGDSNELINAIRSAGFLDGDEIHDWQEYAGRLLEQRAAAKERMRKSRAKTTQPDEEIGHVTDTLREPFANDTRTEQEPGAHVHGRVHYTTLHKSKEQESKEGTDSLADVHKKRGAETLQNPNFCDGNSSTAGVIVPESTQSNEKKIKADAIIEKGNTKPNTERSAPVPYEKIHELFNEIAVSYPKIIKLSDQRKKAIGTRWRETPDLETFEQLFKKAEASPFLKGDNDRNWRASFDWLLKPSNMIKVLEGNYDDAASNGNGSSRPATTPEAFSLSGFKTTEDE